MDFIFGVLVGLFIAVLIGMYEKNKEEEN